MRRACVIGWPIEHSRSPAIHGYWLNRYGIDGSYTKEAVQPGRLEGFLRLLATNGYRGCNITIPYKEEALHLVDEADATASAIGAANTLWLEDGRLYGTNTDAYGYMTYLAARVPGWQRRDAPVVILGAGGAARAIVHGFLESGVGEIRLMNRTRDRADAVARDFGRRVKVKDWSERSVAARDAAVLVNTTAVGLKGDGSLGIDFAGFHPECVVSDIVYVPLETALIRDARRNGLRTVDGLGMLLHQAVPGFEKWFGVRPEVTPELYERIAAGIVEAR
jgi:shikimate dehydrogenase